MLPNKPAAQGMQALPPGKLAYDPGAHRTHAVDDVAPSYAEYVPTPHSAHPPKAAVEYDPDGHSSGVVLPTGQYVPAGQAPEQLDVCIPTVLPKYPPLHGLHNDDDDDDEYCPTGHTITVPFTQNEPTRHSTHTVSLTAYLPASHRVPLTVNAPTPHTEPGSTVHVSDGSEVPGGQNSPAGQGVHIDTFVSGSG